MLLSSLSILMGAILVPNEYLWLYSTYIVLVCLYLIRLKRLITFFFAFISLCFVVSNEFSTGSSIDLFDIDSIVYFDRQEKTLLINPIPQDFSRFHYYKQLKGRIVGSTNDGFTFTLDDVSFSLREPDQHLVRGRLVNVIFPDKRGTWWERKLYIDRQDVQLSIRFDLEKSDVVRQKEPSLRLEILDYFDEQFAMFKTWRFSKALILGEDDKWSERDTWIVRTLGLAHLFVVSGLHVGFVFIIGNGVSFLFWRFAPNIVLFSGFNRWHINTVVIIPMLFFYAYMTDWGEPVLRASIMLSVYLITKALAIKVSPYSIVAFALWVILLIEPRMILSPGLWLSFSMVYFLIGFFRSSTRTKYRVIVGQLMLSTASMVLILGWQEAISSVSIPVNIFLISFAAFVWFPVGLTACLEAYFTSTTYIYEQLDFLLYYLLALIEWSAFSAPLLFFEYFDSDLPRLLMLLAIVYWVFQSPLIRGYAVALCIWFILFSSSIGEASKADLILQNIQGKLLLSDRFNNLFSDEWKGDKSPSVFDKYLRFNTGEKLVFSLSNHQGIAVKSLVSNDVDWVFFKSKPSEKVVTALDALEVNWIYISESSTLKFFREERRVYLRHSACIFSFFLFKSDTCKRVELLESMINYRQI